MLEEKFEFTGAAKQRILKTLGLGVILLIIGIVGLGAKWWGTNDGGHGHGDHALKETSKNLVAQVEHEEEGHEHHIATDVAEHEQGEHAEEAHGHGGHEYSFWTRIKADMWHNNVLFTGIAIIGVFFFAIQFVGWAGWSTLLIRVFLAFGYFLIPAGILMLIGFFVGYHDLFHWTHEGIADPESANYDAIIAGKVGFLNIPFYLFRMIGYFLIWGMMWWFLKRESDKEDLNGGTLYYHRMVRFSAAFLVIFAVTSSTSAWDWVMSIDTHWYSTMFGWYVFASWFVTGLCVITLIVVNLKKAGYLTKVNANHLHNLGLFMFAFSIFWSYIWLSQFLLIWYANIPEESIYFIERFYENFGSYTPVVVLTLLLNFLFPFLFLMTRDAKRQATILQVAAWGIILGHWLDFYMMIMPGTLHENGGLDLGTIFVELGMTMIYASVFIYAVWYGLSKRPLIAKNHPMLDESIHHHI